MSTCDGDTTTCCGEASTCCGEACCAESDVGARRGGDVSASGGGEVSASGYSSVSQSGSNMHSPGIIIFKFLVAKLLYNSKCPSECLSLNGGNVIFLAPI